eukprot:scaffold469_cov160-Amphora_coffeaeformis.AAC.7
MRHPNNPMTNPLGGFDTRAASGMPARPTPQSLAAQALGKVGAAGRGLYLVLHADDIHAVPQTIDALREFLGTANYYTDSLLQKFTQALRSHGQLVVWGTHEMMQQAGATSVQLWMDGDAAQSARMGALMLERAAKLTRHGLFCSILTRDELIAEQRAVAALQWLSEVAKSCDPLCQTVAECILPNRHLVPLLRADFKMNARVTKAWYSLLLTLLAVPTFKSHLAAAYCDTYRNVTAKYARGMGVLERSGYTLSVQFLNRVTYVVDLVRGRDLLGKLGKSLLETMLVSRQGAGLDPMHFVLTHRRYSPCISDLKCVLNVKGMPRLFGCKGGTFLFDWIKTLSLAQQMDPQTWRHWTQGHVEDESRGWVGAFNASISLGSLFERLLGWEDEETSPISDPASPLSKDLMPCSELTCTILVHGVHKWHSQDSHLYQPTPFSTATEPHRRCPVSLPLSHIARLSGSRLAMRHMCVAQSSPISFHLPLHRFAATCVRELCLRRDGAASLVDLFQRIAASLPPLECNDLFMRLMEFPLLVLTRAAQVRAGLWRRNGPGLNDQVLNYAEPPFCRTMRDADLLLVQFAVLGRKQGLNDDSSVGMVYFVHLLLHKLGIFDFCGLLTAPSQDIPLYLQEAEAGLYAKEMPAAEETERSQVVLPWTYTPSRELASSLVLLEEFLRLLIVFASELPHPPPADKSEHTEQARWRLYREVVHRLASGPKTHSELLEVHHVLSHWDNMLLSEEGKQVNPDDATGAALGTVLSEVADRKISRGKLEPDKWEMRRSAWDSYDPSFFHISVRMHQSAADSRPKPKVDPKALFGWVPKPYSPEPYGAHPFFTRLRRDVTADATVVSILYRVLHMHLRSNSSKDTSGLPGSEAYEKEKSETSLARAIHLLTIGVFAWKSASTNDPRWKDNGGGSPGSVFFDWSSTENSPTSSDWASRVLLSNPSKLTASRWYEGEENILDLLNRLAKTGRGTDGFLAQDSSVRAGAAWICQFAMSVSAEAASRLGPKESVSSSAAAAAPKKESDVDMRRRLAREKAMAKMKAQAAKFASMMDVDMDEGDEASGRDTDDPNSSGANPTIPRTPERPLRASSFGSAHSSASSMNSDFGGSPGTDLVGQETPMQDYLAAPPRLLKQRPRCIICNDEESTDIRSNDRGEIDDGEGQRKRSRRKTDNALGFVGYIQASTVLKGGGGTPPRPGSAMTPARGHCGSHVALCGHAVHSECCESYLATVSHREDRAIGKRDEFRCPLCQRLSNCLVPFIDVGVDWIEAPSFLPKGKKSPGTIKSDGDDESAEGTPEGASPVSLHEYLVSTPWWVTKQDTGVAWDGHSAFIDRHASFVPEDLTPGHSKRRNTRRGVRPLTKRDLYAAWNAMMKTPRFVRRRFRSRGQLQEDGQLSEREFSAMIPEPLESTGESVVWRRFMDQVSDISYRADSRRLGDETLHENFGEFRHYIVEKYAYNMANRYVAGDPTEWPHCVFNDTLSDLQRQEMSREKLLSKLFLSIQAFTYSCCCETFEAKRIYLKSVLSPSLRPDASTDSVLSAFGIVGVTCGGQMILMPHPKPDLDDGSQPFNGRLGKLRYLGLAVMAASGPVAADLVQLALSFPIMTDSRSRGPSDAPKPERAPIAFPLLFGNVLSHVVAAMCATCGRGRARSDSLELSWPAPFSQRGSFFSTDPGFPGKDVDSAIQDCEGFIKLGLLARILQVLLARLKAPIRGFQDPSFAVACLASLRTELAPNQDTGSKWTKTCIRLVELALTNRSNSTPSLRRANESFTLETFKEASSAALLASCEFLSYAGAILQVLVPGVLVSYESTPDPVSSMKQNSSPMETFERLRFFLKLEHVDEILTSPLTQEIVANWYDDAVRIGKEALSEGRNDSSTQQALRARLKKTQGFRDYDWPSTVSVDLFETKMSSRGKDFSDKNDAEQPHDSSAMQIELPPMVPSTIGSATMGSPRAPLVTFSSKKTVPLLGGFVPEALESPPRPRVAVMPTSYTDLYAELGNLMPECEQTAVCLVCGEVLNAGGKGECTRHSYKCGAGAGMFFLLQECSGLIMHKSKAAYIHSPYVDSHGETPQYRGRPLNLDLDRYEHLRQVWYGHSVRQQVVAERGSSRQVSKYLWGVDGTELSDVIRTHSLTFLSLVCFPPSHLCFLWVTKV